MKNILAISFIGLILSPSFARAEGYVKKGIYREQLSCDAAVEGMGNPPLSIIYEDDPNQRGFYVVTQNHARFVEAKSLSSRACHAVSDKSGYKDYDYYYVKVPMEDGTSIYETFEIAKNTTSQFQYFAVPDFHPAPSIGESGYCTLPMSDSLDVSSAKSVVNLKLSALIMDRKKTSDLEVKENCKAPLAACNAVAIHADESLPTASTITGKTNQELGALDSLVNLRILEIRHCNGEREYKDRLARLRSLNHSIFIELIKHSAGAITQLATGAADIANTPAYASNDMDVVKDKSTDSSTESKGTKLPVKIGTATNPNQLSDN